MLGGYEITPVYIYESGQWATLQSGRDVNLNNDNAGDRVIVNPAGVGNRGSDVQPITNLDGDTVGYFATDPTARFIRGGTGALLNIGRSTFATPAINNLDLGASKTIKFTEKVELKLGLLAVNVLNHPQYTTGLVSQVDSIGTATNPEQRLVFEPRSSTLSPQWQAPTTSRMERSGI